MASTTSKALPAIVEWPTEQRFDAVRKAVSAAYDALEELDEELAALNDRCLPPEIDYDATAPVSADLIAATLDFVEMIGTDAREITRFAETMATWPVQLVEVRREQRLRLEERARRPDAVAQQAERRRADERRFADSQRGGDDV